jgi:DNA-binding CsgD family transcriptional regulator
VLRTDGVVVEINRPGHEEIGRTREECIGRSLAEILPGKLGSERIEHIGRAASTNSCVHVDGMMNGQMRRCTFRPLPAAPPGAMPHVLHINRPVSPGMAPSVRARHDDRGPLESLTSRELQILTLIACGMTTAQIAKRLHRSTKTIEWHRVALGNKLGVANRVELARIALGLGLVPDEAEPDAADDPAPNPAFD